LSPPSGKSNFFLGESDSLNEASFSFLKGLDLGAVFLGESFLPDASAESSKSSEYLSSLFENKKAEIFFEDTLCFLRFRHPFSLGGLKCLEKHSSCQS